MKPLLREIPESAAPVKVLVVAGEASSDEHAALLIEELLRRAPGSTVFGMGGTQLRNAGVETVVDSEESASVMGLTELGGSVRKLWRAFNKLLQEADRRSPELAILVDFPDFNLRLAKALHRRGTKIFYFISPQLWAWRKGRVKTIKRYVTRVAPIFPFEESFYHRHGVDAEYVGHPFVDRVPLTRSREQFLSSNGLSPELPVVALLPGSRRSEVERLLEPLARAVALLRERRPGLQAVVPVAKTLDLAWVRSHLPAGIDVTLVREQAREVLAAADAAVLASGTITVEAALAGTPSVVVYKLAPFTYRTARLLVRGVPHFAMINLVAGRKVVEELLQDEVTPERIASEVERVLGDPQLRQKMKRELSAVAARLAYPGSDGESAASRAAASALQLVRPTSADTARAR